MAPIRNKATSFACPDCEKTFSRKEYVDRHARTKHFGLKPFICCCTAAFGRSDLLARHKKSCPTWLANPILPNSISSSDSISNSFPSPAIAPATPPIASTSNLASYPSPIAHLLNDPMLIPDFDKNVYEEYSYTQEEISASKVLDLLLRSPITSSHRPWEEESTGIAWHGATANTQADNSAVVLSNSWPANDDIENTPEALALSSYFNAGGIGGISALDLGFVSTPTLFPSHLFEKPILHTDTEKKFFLDGQTFCLGYLYDWQVPPLATLSKFAETASAKLLDSLPIIHSPSLVLAKMTPHTAFALTVVGGAYDTNGEKFATEMTVEKRIYLIRNFNKPGITVTEQFSYLQSLLLYQLLSLFHAEESHRKLSHAFHHSLVEMFRVLDLPTKIATSVAAPIDPTLTGAALTAAWKLWIEGETYRRVAFIVYMLDLETSTIFHTPALLSAQELAIDLPSSDLIWNAPNAVAWLEAYTTEFSPPLPFLVTLRHLLKPDPAYSLNYALTTLSNFPLLILTRCLSSLKAQTEEALKAQDPFKSLIGLGLIDDRAEQNRIALERILNGLSLLKALPGGKKRGTGERWFSNTMPSRNNFTNDFDSPMTNSPSFFSSNSTGDSTGDSSGEDYLEGVERKEARKLDGTEEKVGMAKELDMESKQVKRVLKIVQDDFSRFSNPLYHV